ncbi:cell division protein PerM [Demequina activiva]|uniref:Uncharacterized protein n=1 Tax=Demequina activiva TaxID=1582364 RepID=A0A919ULH8_9MICO|nr:DUF6350 family protein [Demequina activiva]GIG54733.1 hypothetical protein Dac01nite_14850 [Demequina activiva]
MSTRSLASDLRALGRRGIAAVKAAPAWLGGILTGAQGALLSYLLVLAPSMAVVASAPTSSLSRGVDWSGAAGFASQLWLLAHGVPMASVAGQVSLIPLGLTLVCGAILAGVARRFAARTWGSWVLAVASYAVLVGSVASMVGGPQAQGATVRAVLMAIAIAAPSVAIGIWRAHGMELAWLARIPELVRVATRRASASVALIVCAAALAQTAWAIVGREGIGDAATALGLDGVGAPVLAVAELAYAPTMVAWMVAWLSGQGFSVGLGTSYAPDALAVEQVPALPILGALPSAAGGLLVWAPLVIVGVVAAVRVLTPRGALSWRAHVASDGLAVSAVGVAVAVVCLLSSGAAGPGRLETVGPDALPVAVAVAGLAALGFMVGTVVRLAVDLPLVRRLSGGVRRGAPTTAEAPASPPGARRPADASTAR